MKTNLRTQSGYSLVELSISLAIIGVITAGAITGVQSILRTNNVNNVVKQTNLAVGHLIAKTLRLSDTTTITTANMVGLGVWEPSEVSSGTPNHAFSSAIAVGGISAAVNNYPANQTSYYQLKNVPKTACTDIATGLADLGVGMIVNNDTGTPTSAMFTGGNVVKAVDGTLNAANLADKCNVSTPSIALLLTKS